MKVTAQQIDTYCAQHGHKPNDNHEIGGKKYGKWRELAIAHFESEYRKDQIRKNMTPQKMQTYLDRRWPGKTANDMVILRPGGSTHRIEDLAINFFENQMMENTSEEKKTEQFSPFCHQESFSAADMGW